MELYTLLYLYYEGVSIKSIAKKADMTENAVVNALNDELGVRIYNTIERKN